MRGPNRSDTVPQIMLPAAIARNPIVIAVEMPVRDQPVVSVIGVSRTGNENIAPIATQPSNPPAATMTQR
jgi:hypothetical protein